MITAVYFHCDISYLAVYQLLFDSLLCGISRIGIEFTMIFRKITYRLFFYVSSVFMEVLPRVPSYETSREGLTLL